MPNKEKNPKKISEAPRVGAQSYAVGANFISIASHKLKTPMSVARWSLDEVLSGKMGELNKLQKESIDQAYDAISKMNQLVNNLLRASNLESNGINIVCEQIEVASIVKEVIKEYSPYAKACGAKILFSAPRKPLKACYDPSNFRLIVSSLLDNALKYADQKNTIKLSLGAVDDLVTLTVADTGFGIPLNEQPFVFNRFFRGALAAKKYPDGLGLSLYIVKKVVNALGGEISFGSIKNKGTIFTVNLPTIKLEGDKTLKNNDIMQDANESLKKEREFVAITIHELKAPLNATKWSLELLKNKDTGSLNKEQTELIDQILHGNQRLFTLVSDLLNLSKIQEGKFEVEPKAVKFADITDEVIEGFTPQASAKKLTIKKKHAGLKLPKVIADPVRIAQVVSNLISNAIKYTPDNGSIVVDIQEKSSAQLKKISSSSSTINISFTDNKKGYLVISVKDSGIGISEADQKKLFTRFFRSKDVLKSKTEGTGLGLYITKSIVNLHKGDIWFESKVNQGSTFFVSLPIV